MNAALDAIFVYNQEPPESLASIRLMGLIPARHLGALRARDSEAMARSTR